jgi:hypothetical protein
MAGDAEAARHVFQNFGHILAQLAHRPATGRATIRVGYLMQNLIARQVIRQWCTPRFAGRILGQSILGRTAFDDAFGMSVLGLQVFQREFELVGLKGHAFGRLTELHAAQAGKLDLELLDLERGQLNRIAGGLKLLAGLAMGAALGLQCLLRGGQTRLRRCEQRTQFSQIGREFEIAGGHASSYQKCPSAQSQKPGIAPIIGSNLLRQTRWFGRYSPSPIHRLDQQRKLRRRQHNAAFDQRWPDETAALQALGEQA